MSTFKGNFPDHKFVTADNFQGKNRDSMVYFLSHLHDDHCLGLGSEAFHYKLKSDHRVTFITHCTTKDLIAMDSRYNHLKEFVTPVEYGLPQSLDVVDPVTGKTSYKLEFTLLDANHCPGSSMLKLKSNGKVSLYTGDFRDVMHSIFTTEKPEIDTLFLDTTFCIQKAMRFPTVSHSVASVIKLVDDWLKNETMHVVYLEYSSRLGCEPIFFALRDYFNEEIHFSAEQRDIYDGIAETSRLSSRLSNVRIHAGMKQFKKNTVGIWSCRCDLDEKNVRVIGLSAQVFVRDCNREITPVKREGPNKYRVFYSRHSSVEELQKFTTYLCAKKIVPTASPGDKELTNEMMRLISEFCISDRDYRPLGKVSSWQTELRAKKRKLVECSDDDLDFGE